MSDASPAVLKVTDWYTLRKVVYYDTEYKCSWVRNSAELARYFIEEGGFAPVRAFQLRMWMKAQIAGGADGSICFFSQDMVPDLVAETCSPDCLVMEYIRAGGRAVWVGDIPFYYQGRRGGECEDWGVRGQKRVLGLDSIWDLKDEAVLTDEGREWGLTAPGNSSRCVPAGDVTPLNVAGKYACLFFKNFNPAFPRSGFLRLREFLPLKDLLAASQYGIEESEAEPDEASAQNAPARRPAEAAGELVGSGSFLVDRRRALDKLMRFQLPNPETCLLPLVRAALAGKAPRITFAEVRHGLEMKFDGEGFTKERLADPYRSLFEVRTAANAAARHLATGLLSALRLNPQVIVNAGPAGARFRLRIQALGSEELLPSQDPGEGTLIRLLWSGPSAGLAARLLSHLGPHCAQSPAPIFVNGRVLPYGWRISEDMPSVTFNNGALNGVITVPERPAPASFFQAAVGNVLLDSGVSTKLPGLQLLGYLNNDDFTMNISQTGVVNNSRCRKALEAAEKNAPRLLAAALGDQRVGLVSAGLLMLNGGLDDAWKKWLEAGPDGGRGLFSRAAAGIRDFFRFKNKREEAQYYRAAAAVEGAARVTAWVREACFRLLTDHDADIKDPLLKALWEAPAFLTTSGEPVSHARLREQYLKMKFIPYSFRPQEDARMPFDVVWCPSQKDLAALRRWPTADLTSRLRNYSISAAAAEEFMGGAAANLAARRHNIEIAPPDRDSFGAMRPVEIKLAVEKPEIPARPAPAPEPAPPPAAEPEPPPEPEYREEPASPPKQRAQRRKPAPLPTGPELEVMPREKFPELLARLSARISAPGSRLLADFIRKEGAKKWDRKKLPAAVLASFLPPARKAEYLLSVFYTEFNRREVKLTDADDINFQQALAELADGEGVKHG